MIPDFRPTLSGRLFLEVLHTENQIGMCEEILENARITGIPSTILKNLLRQTKAETNHFEIQIAASLINRERLYIRDQKSMETTLKKIYGFQKRIDKLEKAVSPSLINKSRSKKPM